MSEGLLSLDGEEWRADPQESVKWVFPWLGRSQRPNKIRPGPVCPVWSLQLPGLGSSL